MNHNYAKLSGGKMQYAPSTLITPQGIIMNPKRLSYLQAGWKFLDLQAPAEAPEGKEYVISGYTETSTDIRAIYKLVPINPPPCTYSKLRLIMALSKRNLWQQVRDWLIETDLYDLFLARPLAAPSGFARTLLRLCFAKLLVMLVGEPDDFVAGASRAQAT